MESSIKALVRDVKEEMFLDIDPYSLIAASAYDTAWLAMVPNNSDPSQPMFMNCVNWVLINQKEVGFWGEGDGHGMPTIECLPATIACMIALKKWNIGQTMINKGMAFIQANAQNLIEEIYDLCPRWFAITFPAILELACANGLEIIFDLCSRVLKTSLPDYCGYTFQFHRDKQADSYNYPPILAYLEAFPCSIDEEHVVKNLCKDGSLFQSPSATARAFMATKNKDYLAYLQSLVHRCPNGVPPIYPIDEDLIKLSMVNQLKRLGLAEHFNQEIEEALGQVYRNYMNQESCTKPINSVASKLYKDSLAFWLLRMNGYNVSPWIFCWFLLDEEILDHIQKDHELFSSVMLNVHRAADLMFPGECELEDAKSFSRMLLNKSTRMETRDKKNFSLPNFHEVVINSSSEHEKGKP
ncbi:Alpha-bisabolene synthase, putative [Ricinus communis]|uniref:Alpha-bisabolene synthase, putative n=1 Tax=Ricinus communis TaxID=3988 RepID=B9S5Y0_RICCO|nr:Alpha-bisabolene synthase, putative [Ricinus communis]